jgi:signal transduction histidine kinase
MTLSRQHLLMSVALALPAAALVLIAVNALQSREQLALIERVAQGHVVDTMRDACLQDPGWFLAGPRLPRPSLADRQMPDADVHLPRPSKEQLPFEMFAYDETFAPTSVAGPRFPDTMRNQMRGTPPAKLIAETWSSAAGTGVQAAILTGWGGPCSALLFRQQPAPGYLAKQGWLFGGLASVFFLVAMISVRPTGMRVRRLAQAAVNSARSEYQELVKVRGSDEIGSLASQFNETAAELRRKVIESRDREEVLRRYVDNTSADVAEPLDELERHLSTMMAARADRDVVSAVTEAHRINTRLQNHSAVIRLRAITDATSREAVNLAEVISAVVDSRRALAEASEVTIDASKATAPATVQADKALMQQAIANVIDNAIIYNRRGGAVRIVLESYDRGQRFKLLVADTGPGVSDEDFSGLTANKRFRGDESRTRRPGGRGLGLALAREVADRFGMQFDLRQPSAGGFEAEFSSRT